MVIWKIVKEVFFIIIGMSIYVFGFVYLNIVNYLVEGGVLGIILILRVLFGIDLVYMILLINILLILLGGKIFGKCFLVYIVLGIFFLLFFLWIW